VRVTAATPKTVLACEQGRSSQYDQANNNRGKKERGQPPRLRSKSRTIPGISNGGLDPPDLCSRKQAFKRTSNYATPRHGHSRKAQRNGEIAEREIEMLK
jgi:hypothetical protein